jgi:hypothetical protein
VSELIANVSVDGVWYGPDHGSVSPPADVVERITNPKVWSNGAPGVSDADPASEPVSDTAEAESKSEPSNLDSDDDNPSLDELTKKELAALADDKGVEVDKRWGKAKLIEALADDSD